jgi:hypothetical protein
LETKEATVVYFWGLSKCKERCAKNALYLGWGENNLFVKKCVIEDSVMLVAGNIAQMMLARPLRSKSTLLPHNTA